MPCVHAVARTGTGQQPGRWSWLQGLSLPAAMCRFNIITSLMNVNSKLQSQTEPLSHWYTYLYRRFKIRNVPSNALSCLPYSTQPVYDNTKYKLY